MCAPPHSAESERLSSAGENIFAAKRNHLQAETGEMFLHYNVRVLDLENE